MLQTGLPIPDPLNIPGFAYHESVLTPREEADLQEHIAANAARWEQDYARRAQRYGYSANTLTRLDPLPGWLEVSAVRPRELGWMHATPDQGTVQEYEPGAGISEHIDDPKCFGPEIVTLSLLSPRWQRIGSVLPPETKVI